MAEINASSYFKTGGNTIANLVGITPDTNGAVYNAISYFNEWVVPDPVIKQGGKYVFDDTVPKTQHDGVTVISPTVPWDGKEATLTAFQGGTGEKDIFGTGCWLLVDSDGLSGGATGSASAVSSPTTIGGLRFFGHQAGGNVNSAGGATGVAFQAKFQAEAKARRVRVRFHNRNTTYPVGPWMFSIAPTEDPSFATASRFSQPILNGVPITALATNDATKFGYRVGTFGGNQLSPLVPPGSFDPDYTIARPPFKPSGQNYSSYFNSVGTVVSDWMDLNSLDATNGSIWPYYLFRCQMMDTAANPYGGRYSGSWDVQANTTVSIDVRARPNFREFQGVQATVLNPGDNYVLDPSLTFPVPADLQDWVLPNFTLEFDYGVPTRSVLGPGDSVMEGYLWAQLGFADLSTPERPIGFVNAGESARTSFGFKQMIEIYSDSGMYFTDIIQPVFSVNDYNPVANLNDFEVEKIISRVMDRIAYINSLGAKAWVWTTFNGRPGHTYFTRKAQIDALNNFFRNYAEKNPTTCGIFDFEANWTDGLGPDKYSEDGTHPNNRGIMYMESVVVSSFK